MAKRILTLTRPWARSCCTLAHPQLSPPPHEAGPSLTAFRIPVDAIKTRVAGAPLYRERYFLSPLPEDWMDWLDAKSLPSPERHDHVGRTIEEWATLTCVRLTSSYKPRAEGQSGQSSS